MESSNCGCEAIEDVHVFPREVGLSVLKSPVYFVTALMWLICTIACVAYFVNLFSSVRSIATDVVSLFGANMEKNPELYFNIILGAVFALIALPMCLKSIGILTSAIKAKRGDCGGIGFIRAGFFFSVISAIVEILFLVGYGIVVSVLNTNSIDFVNFWVTCTLIVTVLIFIIVFYVKVLNSFAIVRVAVEQNKCHSKSTMYVVFMSFFMAIPMLLMTISQGFSLYGSMAWLGVVFMLTYSMSYVLLGVTLMLLRRIDISDGIGDEYKMSSTLSVKAGTNRESFRCRYCGRMLAGAEVCLCQKTGYERMSPKINEVVRKLDVSSGGLRSTMKKNSRTSEEMPVRETINGEIKKFFITGGDLD